ncbi:hypothetical protein SAMN05880582_1011368 [Rhizobium sp. RU20A]|uniref:type II toxin-antitoxin system VapC family toxin n=1 Tax=Rhizobium sp. RU20A TaxID=1907412 RepID=UPI000956138E|nr:hypothetical protein SAMN05880582_1011368 [Rhizobium sp. RU20A]
MYLLDTNVLSEARKIESGRADPRVVSWFSMVSEVDLHISVLTLFEIQKGMLLKARRDAVQARQIQIWLIDWVRPAFEGRIVGLNEEAALKAAELHVPDPRPLLDALIAATALVHGLTLVTRNTRDFRSTGVSLLDPFETPSSD